MTLAFQHHLPSHVHGCYVLLFADNCKIFKCLPKFSRDFGIVPDDLNSISNLTKKCRRKSLPANVKFYAE